MHAHTYGHTLTHTHTHAANIIPLNERTPGCMKLIINDCVAISKILTAVSTSKVAHSVDVSISLHSLFHRSWLTAGLRSISWPPAGGDHIHIYIYIYIYSSGVIIVGADWYCLQSHYCLLMASLSRLLVCQQRNRYFRIRERGTGNR